MPQTNTIKFSVGVRDNKNQPLPNTPVICKSFNMDRKKGTCQSYMQQTDHQGTVKFEFESKKDSIEVDIMVDDYDISYAFQDGEEVTVKLLRVNF